MRRAAGQAVICEALSAYIFRPFYVPHDFKQAADQMLEFFEEEKELQQVFRHQVTKFQDDSELEAAAEAVVDAGGYILRLLDRLVSRANVQEFHRRVDEFLRRAAQVWVHEAQPASDIVQVTILMGEDEHMESYPEFGVRNAGKVGIANHTIVATLFPRITINGKMLHGGKVLWSDSPATIIARDQNPSPTLGRTGTLRKNGRRNSVTGRPAT
ncbi:hypothetical protein HRG_009707 [Hirsutella rhossiliensis]|uniref:Uncharacterized protein n=1 Tax=Hirsutella rhossiliensis TaxID=111463 RepID=A0A9P8MS70_9HYPO|nr:uncharacterized protein HRG_09707 [Hirsutella rhossiliensis]KAH0959246.1 hypothetical protein HRG_09707 [Hirsutella rhossiliensis]